MTQTLERAIAIAAAAHAGQLDKGGAPYILHPLKVMLRMTSLEERIVAVLHDVVEDCGLSLDDLRKEGFSEAAVMADYLVDHGKIAREAILLDEQGNTTRDTAINSAGIMKGKGFTSAVVVTQYFHVTRSQYALKQAGVMQVSTAHARYFEWRDLYSIAREVVALPAYWWAAST